MSKYKTLGAVESFTGGLFSATITKKPGASKYFKGSLVAYASEIKAKLGIDISNGVVSKLVAQEMALKGREYLNVDLCISFTGVAGPTISEGKEVGTTFIAFNEIVFEKFFKGTRNEIRKQAVDFSLIKMKQLFNLST